MTLVFVIIFISILILVHEWGHFYASRRLGIKIEEFGFGFPPRLFSRVRKGVRYSFNLFPFGGFVKIFGEHGEGEGSRESFASRTAGQRFVILAAGVAMNAALAWLLFSVAAAVGLPRLGDEAAGAPVSILGVLPGSPAEQAGLKLGDQILEIRAPSPSALGLGAPEASLRIEKEEDVRTFIDAYRGEEITLVIRRRDEAKEISTVPRAEVPQGEGPLGIMLGRLAIERSPLYAAPLAGIEMLVQSTAAIILGIADLVADLVIQGRAPAAVSGPIGILVFARDSGALGMAYFMQFIGILSVNLAVLNFLPIPALDGGRALFLLFEKIKGSRINPRLEQLAHGAGFVLLVLLMLLVTYRDLARVL